MCHDPRAIIVREDVAVGASLVAQTVKNLPAMQETWVWSLAPEEPLEEGTASSIPVFLSGEFCGLRSLAGYSPWGLFKQSD